MCIWLFVAFTLVVSLNALPVGCFLQSFGMSSENSRVHAVLDPSVVTTPIYDRTLHRTLKGSTAPKQSPIFKTTPTPAFSILQPNARPSQQPIIRITPTVTPVHSKVPSPIAQPDALPSPQPIVGITPTVTPDHSIITSPAEPSLTPFSQKESDTSVPSPIAQSLSPLSQEESDSLSPQDPVPSVDLSGTATLMTILGAALASLVLSVFVLRARHRYVQKHGAASSRRRQRLSQMTTKPEDSIPAGVEINDTLEIGKPALLDDSL
jgi:hypothetical protein